MVSVDSKNHPRSLSHQNAQKHFVMPWSSPAGAVRYNTMKNNVAVLDDTYSGRPMKRSSFGSVWKHASVSGPWLLNVSGKRFAQPNRARELTLENDSVARSPA